MEDIEYLEEYKDLIQTDNNLVSTNPTSTSNINIDENSGSSSSLDQDIFNILFDNHSDDENEDQQPHKDGEKAAKEFDEKGYITSKSSQKKNSSDAKSVSNTTSKTKLTNSTRVCDSTSQNLEINVHNKNRQTKLSDTKQQAFHRQSNSDTIINADKTNPLEQRCAVSKGKEIESPKGIDGTPLSNHPSRRHPATITKPDKVTRKDRAATDRLNISGETYNSISEFDEDGYISDHIDNFDGESSSSQVIDISNDSSGSRSQFDDLRVSTPSPVVSEDRKQSSTPGESRRNSPKFMANHEIIKNLLTKGEKPKLLQLIKQHDGAGYKEETSAFIPTENLKDLKGEPNILTCSDIDYNTQDTKSPGTISHDSYFSVVNEMLEESYAEAMKNNRHVGLPNQEVGAEMEIGIEENSKIGFRGFEDDREEDNCKKGQNNETARKTVFCDDDQLPTTSNACTSHLKVKEDTNDNTSRENKAANQNKELTNKKTSESQRGLIRNPFVQRTKKQSSKPSVSHVSPNELLEDATSSITKSNVSDTIAPKKDGMKLTTSEGVTTMNVIEKTNTFVHFKKAIQNEENVKANEEGQKLSNCMTNNEQDKYETENQQKKEIDKEIQMYSALEPISHVSHSNFNESLLTNSSIEKCKSNLNDDVKSFTSLCVLDATKRELVVENKCMPKDESKYNRKQQREDDTKVISERPKNSKEVGRPTDNVNTSVHKKNAKENVKEMFGQISNTKSEGKKKSTNSEVLHVLEQGGHEKSLGQNRDEKNNEKVGECSEVESKICELKDDIKTHKSLNSRELEEKVAGNIGIDTNKSGKIEIRSDSKIANINKSEKIEKTSDSKITIKDVCSGNTSDSKITIKDRCSANISDSKITIKDGYSANTNDSKITIKDGCSGNTSIGAGSTKGVIFKDIKSKDNNLTLNNSLNEANTKLSLVTKRDFEHSKPSRERDTSEKKNEKFERDGHCENDINNRNEVTKIKRCEIKIKNISSKTKPESNEFNFGNNEHVMETEDGTIAHSEGMVVADQENSKQNKEKIGNITTKVIQSSKLSENVAGITNDEHAGGKNNSKLMVTEMARNISAIIASDDNISEKYPKQNKNSHNETLLRKKRIIKSVQNESSTENNSPEETVQVPHTGYKSQEMFKSVIEPNKGAEDPKNVSQKCNVGDSTIVSNYESEEVHAKNQPRKTRLSKQFVQPQDNRIFSPTKKSDNMTNIFGKRTKINEHKTESKISGKNPTTLKNIMTSESIEYNTKNISVLNHISHDPTEEPVFSRAATSSTEVADNIDTAPSSGKVRNITSTKNLQGDEEQVLSTTRDADGDEPISKIENFEVGSHIKKQGDKNLLTCQSSIKSFSNKEKDRISLKSPKKQTRKAIFPKPSKNVPNIIDEIDGHIKRNVSEGVQKHKEKSYNLASKTKNCDEDSQQIRTPPKKFVVNSIKCDQGDLSAKATTNTRSLRNRYAESSPHSNVSVSNENSICNQLPKSSSSPAVEMLEFNVKRKLRSPAKDRSQTKRQKVEKAALKDLAPLKTTSTVSTAASESSSFELIQQSPKSSTVQNSEVLVQQQLGEDTERTGSVGKNKNLLKKSPSSSTVLSFAEWLKNNGQKNNTRAKQLHNESQGEKKVKNKQRKDKIAERQKQPKIEQILVTNSVINDISSASSQIEKSKVVSSKETVATASEISENKCVMKKKCQPTQESLTEIVTHLTDITKSHNRSKIKKKRIIGIGRKNRQKKRIDSKRRPLSTTTIKGDKAKSKRSEIDILIDSMSKEMKDAGIEDLLKNSKNVKRQRVHTKRICTVNTTKLPDETETMRKNVGAPIAFVSNAINTEDCTNITTTKSLSQIRNKKLNIPKDSKKEFLDKVHFEMETEKALIDDIEIKNLNALISEPSKIGQNRNVPQNKNIKVSEFKAPNPPLLTGSPYVNSTNKHGRGNEKSTSTVRHFFTFRCRKLKVMINRSIVRKYWQDTADANVILSKALKSKSIQNCGKGRNYLPLQCHTQQIKSNQSPHLHGGVSRGELATDNLLTGFSSNMPCTNLGNDNEKNKNQRNQKLPSAHSEPHKCNSPVQTINNKTVNSVPESTLPVELKNELLDDHASELDDAILPDTPTLLARAKSVTQAAASALSNAVLQNEIRSLSSTLPTVNTCVPPFGLVPTLVDSRGTRMYTFLHPEKYNHNHGNVLLDCCCPNLNGPMPAIDPTRIHAQIQSPVIELPSFIVLETKIVTRAELESNSSTIPATIRKKADKLRNSIANRQNMTVSQRIPTNVCPSIPITFTQRPSKQQNQTPHSLSPITMGPNDLNVSPNFSPALNALTKYLPSTTTITAKVRPPLPQSSRTVPLPSVSSHNKISAISVVPKGSSELNEMQVNLLRSNLRRIDVIFKKMVQPFDKLNFTDRHKIIDNLVSAGKFQTRDLDRTIMLMEEYLKQISIIQDLRVVPKNTYDGPTTTNSSHHIQMPPLQPTPSISSNQSRFKASVPPQQIEQGDDGKSRKAQSALHTIVNTTPGNQRQVPIYDTERNIIGYQLQVITPSNMTPSYSKSAISTAASGGSIVSNSLDTSRANQKKNLKRPAQDPPRIFYASHPLPSSVPKPNNKSLEYCSPPLVHNNLHETSRNGTILTTVRSADPSAGTETITTTTTMATVKRVTRSRAAGSKIIIVSNSNEESILPDISQQTEIKNESDIDFLG
ncbi:uncharacterized protein LOC142241501 isoform X2 [Haematobia irritans]|uniref:uncharacterized protein LOC142241501 isoform X2 n=1 Tax=Haematobia irritans TaxID=7368 RepID=UPI003F5077F9